MKDKVKNHILKYIRKYISLAVAIVALPFLTVNSFAFTIPLNSVVVKPDAGIEMKFTFSSSNGFVAIDAQYDPGEYSTEFHTSGLDATVSRITMQLYSSEFTYSYNYDAYDYYYAINYFFNNEDSYFNCDNLRVATYGENNEYVLAEMSDLSYDNTSMTVNNVYYKVFSAIGKLPSSYGQHSVNVIYISGNGYVGNAEYNECTCYLYQVPKNTSTEEVNALITAINNQTTQLGGQLEGIDSSVQQGNDLIENGTDETQQAVTDFNEVFEDFNTQLEEIESFETQFTEDWNAANETYLNEISQFTMPYGVINAGNWLSTSMQTVYDNADDYKMLWLVPLLLGVPLVIFFFKRGDNSE